MIIVHVKKSFYKVTAYVRYLRCDDGLAEDAPAAHHILGEELPHDYADVGRINLFDNKLMSHLNPTEQIAKWSL